MQNVSDIYKLREMAEEYKRKVEPTHKTINTTIKSKTDFAKVLDKVKGKL